MNATDSCQLLLAFALVSRRLQLVLAGVFELRDGGPFFPKQVAYDFTLLTRVVRVIVLEVNGVAVFGLWRLLAQFATRKQAVLEVFLRKLILPQLDFQFLHLFHQQIILIL